MIRKKRSKIILAGIVLAAYLALSFCLRANSDNYSQKIKEQQAKSKINSIKGQYNNTNTALATNPDDKMVVINVVNFGRKNPFKPYEKVSMTKGNLSKPIDIPPPPTLDPTMATQLQDLVSAKVSGILYDPNGKSVAIINVKGADYMVRRGDSLFGYTVRSIGKTSTSIAYGNNVYEVNVGDVIGQESINYDPVQRQNQSFGGTQRYSRY